MAFQQIDGRWKPKLPDHKLGEAFAVGEWNLGPGGGRFAPVMRPVLNIAEKAKLIKAAGGTHLEFHDTEAEPHDAPEITKIVRGEGLGIYMCTANLFKRGPEFADGNFCSANPDVRKAAIDRTCAYIKTGIEVYDASVYVYWNGSNGFSLPLGVNYRDAYLRTAESLDKIVEWMLATYGAEKALPICIEPKANEPPGWGIPADCGEALTIISMLDPKHQDFVGTNIETCHSQLCGKRYAAELGLAAAAGKAYYCHLNGGTGLKFDEDRAFGDGDFTVAVETVVTLQDIGFKGVPGIDVQPLNTDRADQQNASVARSIRNFRRALACAARINRAELDGYRAKADQAGIADLFARAVSGVD